MERLTDNQIMTIGRMGGLNFIPSDTSRKTVNSLVRRGYLKRDEKGYYWITEKGVVAINKDNEL